MTRNAVFALALFLSGCVSVSAPVDGRQIWCDHNSPLTLSNAATAPRSEVDAVNNHNDQGINWCGWKEI